MMRPIKTCFTALMLSAAFCVSHSAFADIVISGTRVIYPQSAKDVTVKMENRGNKPLLVQTWLDDGRDTANPQEIKLPFIVTPPVSRVDAAKARRYVLPILVSLCPPTEKQCTGLTCWKYHQKQRR